MYVYIVFLFDSWGDSYDVEGVFTSEKSANDFKLELEKKYGEKIDSVDIDMVIIEKHEVKD